MKASICYRNSFVFMPITFFYHQLSLSSAAVRLSS
jgi:hypothetical protein